MQQHLFIIASMDDFPQMKSTDDLVRAWHSQDEMVFEYGPYKNVDRETAYRYGKADAFDNDWSKDGTFSTLITLTPFEYQPPFE